MSVMNEERSTPGVLPFYKRLKVSLKIRAFAGTLKPKFKNT